MFERVLSYYRTRTYREKMVLGLLAALLIITIFFLLLIYPKVQDYRRAESALERAKGGYSFILKNASRVTPSSVVSIDSTRDVKSATESILKTLGVKDFIVRAQDHDQAQAEIEEAMPLSKVMTLLTKLETDFGVTVDEISLDKQGDGVVYVTKLVLIRLSRED